MEHRAAETKNTEPLYGEIIADEDQVNERIEEMAADIVERYKDEKPLFVCLLRGGSPFASKLMFAISQYDPSFHPEMDYMTVKTYGDKRTDDPPELIMDLAPNTKAEGRRAILLDDTLDKGITAVFASNILQNKHGAEDVDCIVLVQKQYTRAEPFCQATMYGFEAPNVWLTGMGLDDPRYGREANRWLPFIAIATADAEPS